MLKAGDELYKQSWLHCYAVGELLQIRGHDVVGISTEYHDRGDWSYYITVDHIIKVYDSECWSKKEQAETIKDVVVRIEDKIKATRDKMTWNYRVIRNGGYLSIHEAYYDGQDTEPHSITLHPVILGGETIEELLADLEYMKTALQKPIIEYDRFDNKKE